MSEIKPVSFEEFNAGAAAKLARGELFTVLPMTVRDIDYPKVFAASNLPLRDFLAMAAARVAGREFMVRGEVRLSVAQTWEKVCTLSQGLIAQYKIGPGDHVALAMRNYPEWVIAYFAIISTGAVVVPLNAWWKTEEFSYALKDCGAKLVFCDAKRLDYLKPLRHELGLKLIITHEKADGADDSFDAIMASSPSKEKPSNPINPDDDFCILYTSGSTGKPKGARLTSRGALSAVLTWAFTSQLMQELRPESKFVPDDPKILMALPLFHVTASHSILLLSWVMGRTIIFMDRWDAKEAVKLIKKEHITNFSGVPTMTHELVLAASPGELDSMVDITSAGAKRPEEHVSEQVTKFPKLSASSGYGMTETNGLGTHNAMGDYASRPASTGRVLPPLSQFQIWDDKGNSLPTGEVGEVMIKSPANFVGYLNLPEETAKTLTKDGWLHTGDLGRFDEEGFLYIVDRLKDMIIRGGENISCLEVENAIYKYPGIAEVTVFSVPDDRLNEIVGAVIYPKSGETIDLKTLQSFLGDFLAPYKVPERMWLSPQALPRGGTGKIDKRMTRSIALQNPPHFSA